MKKLLALGFMDMD